MAIVAKATDRRAGALSGQSWTNVVVAAFAMLATLPGRTHGLGLVTEPLLRDFQLDNDVGRNRFSQINLVATLLGAAFCLPAGRMLDRFGSRAVLVCLMASLGEVVVEMAAATTVVWLALGIFLSRGIGQSALSVASISLVGKSFPQRSGPPMAVYSVLVGLTFAFSFKIVGAAVAAYGWRYAWVAVGAALVLVFTPAARFLVRTRAEDRAELADDRPAAGSTLRQALRTHTFWIFGGGASLYGLASSGLGLYHESVLKELGFDAQTYYSMLTISTLAGLVGQGICGAASLKISLNRLLGAGLLLYAAALSLLPYVVTFAHVTAYAVAMGVAGGFVTVLFFAIWSQSFGPAHLGRIQGAAQMLTVLASAVGPLVFSECRSRTGSYTPALWTLGAVVALVAALAAVLPPPPIQPSENHRRDAHA